MYLFMLNFCWAVYLKYFFLFHKFVNTNAHRPVTIIKVCIIKYLEKKTNKTLSLYERQHSSFTHLMGQLLVCGAYNFAMRLIVQVKFFLNLRDF